MDNHRASFPMIGSVFFCLFWCLFFEKIKISSNRTQHSTRTSGRFSLLFASVFCRFFCWSLFSFGHHASTAGFWLFRFAIWRGSLVALFSSFTSGLLRTLRWFLSFSGSFSAAEACFFFSSPHPLLFSCVVTVYCVRLNTKPKKKLHPVIEREPSSGNRPRTSVKVFDWGEALSRAPVWTVAVRSCA